MKERDTWPWCEVAKRGKEVRRQPWWLEREVEVMA